jgi:hypothetical protein
VSWFGSCQPSVLVWNLGRASHLSLSETLNPISLYADCYSEGLLAPLIWRTTFCWLQFVIFTAALHIWKASPACTTYRCIKLWWQRIHLKWESYMQRIPLSLIWSVQVKLAPEISDSFTAEISFVVYTTRLYLPGEVESSSHPHLVIIAWPKEFQKEPCTLDRRHFYSGSKCEFYTKERITKAFMRAHDQVYSFKTFLWS